MAIRYNKEVYEGWTVQDLIDELEPSVEMIMNGESWREPFRNVSELRMWVGDNQPFMKKPDPDVVQHFAEKYGFSKDKGMER